MLSGCENYSTLLIVHDTGRKRQEKFDDLHEQIRSLKKQAQAFTDVSIQCLDVDNLSSHDDLRLPSEYIPSYLFEDGTSTTNPSTSAFDIRSQLVPQQSMSETQTSSTETFSIPSEAFRYREERSSHSSSIQQHHCAFDALAKNAALLGISPTTFFSTDSKSIFYSPLESLSSIRSAIQRLPKEFHPTMAQLSYPHQPWIDCIPIRDLRSRLIFALSHRPPFLDSLDVWHDVLSDGLSCASDPRNSLLWTMSDSFMQRWQMLLTMDISVLEQMCLTSNPPLLKRNLP